MQKFDIVKYDPMFEKEIPISIKIINIKNGKSQVIKDVNNCKNNNIKKACIDLLWSLSNDNGMCISSGNFIAKREF